MSSFPFRGRDERLYGLQSNNAGEELTYSVRHVTCSSQEPSMSEYCPVSFSSVVLCFQTTLQMFRNKNFTVRRRFSDFLGLYEKLSEKHGPNGFIVPPPPEKSILGRLTPAFVSASWLKREPRSGQLMDAMFCWAGMTKVKVGKEDSSSADFVERRRGALERWEACSEVTGKSLGSFFITVKSLLPWWRKARKVSFFPCSFYVTGICSGWSTTHRCCRTLMSESSWNEMKYAKITPSLMNEFTAFFPCSFQFYCLSEVQWGNSCFIVCVCVRAYVLFSCQEQSALRLWAALASSKWSTEQRTPSVKWPSRWTSQTWWVQLEANKQPSFKRNWQKQMEKKNVIFTAEVTLHSWGKKEKKSKWMNE